jgi:hypothetical protein
MAASNSTWTAASRSSPDLKWRLMTRLLGMGLSAMVKGFRRRPFAGTEVRVGGRRWKASQGGNRGEEGGWFGGGGLWGFEDGGRPRGCGGGGRGRAVLASKPMTAGVLNRKLGGCGASGAIGGGLATSRGPQLPDPARGWKRKRSRLEAGIGGDGHEVSILIRLGEGERAGRGPWNVSTMIIRPPQHGQRRAGETSPASLSVSAHERLGAA